MKSYKLKTNPAVIYHLVREDGRLERVCKHGIGHPVGNLHISQLRDDCMWIHGCDYCCRNYKKQSV